MINEIDNNQYQWLLDRLKKEFPGHEIQYSDLLDMKVVFIVCGSRKAAYKIEDNGHCYSPEYSLNKDKDKETEVSNIIMYFNREIHKSKIRK